ncbi:MAG: hypothetical protein H0T21_09065 [Gemmatimonadaceae bacterium]|nr:hypothetical protein [Gemmatimonadaceae bacterium]
MIRQLAFRNIAYRPWRSLLLFFGYGIGVSVMIVLLSIGEAMLSQARSEKLVGGGSITVLPEGLDVEVMKSGGIGGLFFSITNASFLYRQLFAAPRLESSVAAVAPQIGGRLLYLRSADGVEHAVKASGEIPSASARVGAGPVLLSGKWDDDASDRRWIAPAPAELRHDIDHFHLPPDSVSDRDTWAEWHYFNVLSADKKRWAFISFIVGGDVTGTEWGGKLGITLREENGRSRRFGAEIDRARVRFSTTDANLVFGDSRVTVLPDGDYDVLAVAREEGGSGTARIKLRVHPAANAYFPGVSMGSSGFVSGYTVPGLRADATGSICVDDECESYVAAQSYHDHNWGVWRGVTWEWGASRAGEYSLLYGRVHSPDSAASVPPLLVYLVDSLGFRAVFRPARIAYEDGRSTVVAGKRIAVPSTASFIDARGDDTLRVDLTIEDAIATDTRPRTARREGQRGDPLGTASAKPYFIQMKGVARISGRIAGKVLSGTGTGFFETYR